MIKFNSKSNHFYLKVIGDVTKKTVNGHERLKGIKTYKHFGRFFALLHLAFKDDETGRWVSKRSAASYLKRNHAIINEKLIVPEVMGLKKTSPVCRVERAYSTLKKQLHTAFYIPIASELSTQAAPLNQLETINQRSVLSGINGDGIFVDITASGGCEAIKALKYCSSLQITAENVKIKKCHFGVACFVNFAIAAANKSDKILLLDYDPVVVRFNRIARNALITSEDREQFKLNFINACKKDKQISERRIYPITSNASQGIDHLDDVLNIDESFLANDEDFKHIKKIAVEGNLHIYQGSIYDSVMVEKITALTKEEGAVIDSMFVSNVYDWDANTEKRELFIKNVQMMADEATKIVEVAPNAEQKCVVNILQYKDPISHQLYDPKNFRDVKSEPGQHPKDLYPGAILLN